MKLILLIEQVLKNRKMEEWVVDISNRVISGLKLIGYQSKHDLVIGFKKMRFWNAPEV